MVAAGTRFTSIGNCELILSPSEEVDRRINARRIFKMTHATIARNSRKHSVAWLSHALNDQFERMIIVGFL